MAFNDYTFSNPYLPANIASDIVSKQKGVDRQVMDFVRYDSNGDGNITIMDYYTSGNIGLSWLISDELSHVPSNNLLVPGVYTTTITPEYFITDQEALKQYNEKYRNDPQARNELRNEFLTVYNNAGLMNDECKEFLEDYNKS